MKGFMIPNSKMRLQMNLASAENHDIQNSQERFSKLVQSNRFVELLIYFYDQ